MNFDTKTPVSIVASMRNSATTIESFLNGLISQQYPITEIMLFDNGSTDDSVRIAEEIASRSSVPLRLIKRTAECALADSYNSGAAMAVSDLVVFCHSDGAFPSDGELEKLTAPLRSDPNAVAAYPLLLMPRDVWNLFPFWQKRLFAKALEREEPSQCGKFDCVRKDVWLKIGGLDGKRFNSTCGYGGEDADVNFRLEKVGARVSTDARVIHLHDRSGRFALRSLFATRKLLVRTYGKILRFQGMRSALKRKLLLFVRPALAVFPLIYPPWTLLPGLALQLAFSLANSWGMYASRSALLNWRILLLPFVDVALLYYETFWFIEGLFTRPADACCRRT